MARAFWFSSLLLGFLAAFLTSAVTWSLADEAESHFGLGNDVTSLTFVRDGSDAPQSQAGEAITEFLRSHSLTLLVVAGGDGAPQVAAYNPGKRVPWLSTTTGSVNLTPVYLFEGTYSDDRWRQERSRPLVPPALDIAGSVARPPGIDRQQYVVVDLPGRVPSGQFVLTTRSSAEVDHFVALAFADGLSVQGSRTQPLSALASDPLVVLSLLMLATGTAGTVAYWINLLGRQELETTIRYQSGGPVSAVVAQYLRRFAVGPVVGFLLGCLASLAVVRIAAGQWSDWSDARGIVLTAAVGAVAVCGALSGVLLAVVRQQVKAP